MSEQFLALGFLLVGAVVFAIYGMWKRLRVSDSPVVPAFRMFTEEVGRAAEEGATVHVALGSGGLLGKEGMISIAALQGLAALTELSAMYDTPPYITTGDPTLFLVASTQLHEAYARQTNGQRYRQDSVQFVAPTPMLYAAMSGALIMDKPIAANIELGAFDQEVSLLTHAAKSKGTRSYGGAASAVGVSALYPDLDDQHLIIGEQIFAGGAEATGRSAYWASLGTQNVLRWLVIIGILLAAITSALGITGG